jgi:hypothetical protein
MADEARSTKSTRSEDRRRRLAAELRANLGKRKEQTRARAAERRAPVHQGADNSKESDR